MKKILLIACLLAGSLTTFAQVYNDTPPVTFGLKAGVNFATLQETTQGSSGATSAGTLTSFHAGVFADFRFGDFSVQPSLLYMGKGATSKENVSEDGFTENSNVKLTLNYLEVPIYAIYHVPVDDNEFYFGVGPFIAYGLNGNEKGTVSGSFDGQSESDPINQKVDFGSSNDTSGVKRMDYGASALVGFKFNNGFSVSAFYDFGLGSLATSDETTDPAVQGGSATISEPNEKVKTRVFGVSLGFSF